MTRIMRVTAWLFVFGLDPSWRRQHSRQPRTPLAANVLVHPMRVKARSRRSSLTRQDNIKDYEELVRQYGETIARNNEEFDRIKLDEAKRKEFLRTKHDWIVQQEFAGRFLKLARSQPGSPAAFNSLAWVAAFVQYLLTPKRPPPCWRGTMPATRGYGRSARI